MDLKFGGKVYLDNISDELESHTSKIKVTWLKNIVFSVSENGIDTGGCANAQAFSVRGRPESLSFSSMIITITLLS